MLTVLLASGATLKLSIRWKHLVFNLFFLFNCCLVVEQVKDGEYVYTVHVDGAEIGSTKNPNPAEFSDVFIYASDPWYLAQPACVRAVTIETILVIAAYIFTFCFSNN